jgi:hypothetical protein
MEVINVIKKVCHEEGPSPFIERKNENVREKSSGITAENTEDH